MADGDGPGPLTRKDVEEALSGMSASMSSSKSGTMRVGKAREGVGAASVLVSSSLSSPALIHLGCGFLFICRKCALSDERVAHVTVLTSRMTPSSSAIRVRSTSLSPFRLFLFHRRVASTETHLERPDLNTSL